MPQGYGTEPGPWGDQGIQPAPIPTPEQQYNDIRAIREKYYGPTAYSAEVLEDSVLFNLAPGATLKVFDDPNSTVNSIIVTCETGTTKVWLRDNTGRPGQQSHIIVPSGGPSPQYILAHLKGRVITVGNDPASITNAIGCVTIGRI